MRPAVVAGLLLLVVIVLEFYSVWRALLIAIHNGCFTCAPCQGDAFQWVRAPPGNRSSRKQPEQSWR
jgi:hypothetical protein